MRRHTLVLIFGILVIHASQSEGKILSKCEAVKVLKEGKLPATFHTNWICLMQSVSGFNTNLIRGPGTASSYSYGIFQISSLKYCARGHSGGLCNKRCELFADDYLLDDVECAQKIFERDGFKAWKAWEQKCKTKPLPSISECKSERSVDNELQEEEPYDDDIYVPLEMRENTHYMHEDMYQILPTQHSSSKRMLKNSY